jgi:hypothetical protein
MKYVARVRQVLRPGIHTVGAIRADQVETVAAMASPTRLEIELEGTAADPCMMFRWNDAGDFCGDTWHEDLQHAFAQAAFEYGLSPEEFRLAADDNQ